MIFTHTGRLGDFFASLPVISWWHKKNIDEPIHIILAKNIEFIESAIEFCKIVPFVTSVTKCDYMVDNFNMGGQPYKFDPNLYGSIIKGDYINIGFRSRPDKFISEFYAEEHKIGVDYDFEIHVPNFETNHDNKIVYSLPTDKINKYYKTLDDNLYLELDPKVSILKNLSICKKASKVYTAPHGFSVALNLCKIPCTVFANNLDWIDRFFYFKNRETEINKKDNIWKI